MILAEKLALVNWEMGTFLIGIFFVVCAALILIILKMAGKGKL